MKTIDLTNISDPSVAQPFTGPSLSFVQSSTKEIVGATIQSMIGDVPSTTVPYLLYGLIKTSLGGNDYSYTAGAVYYNGEVYLFDAVASITINDTDTFSITVTQDATADPLTFTDEVVRNVHNIRKLTVSDTTTGSNEFDFGELTGVNIDPQIAVVNVTPEVVGSGYGPKPVIKLASSDIDNYSIVDLGAETITPTRAGFYEVSLQMEFTQTLVSSPAQIQSTAIRKNGSNAMLPVRQSYVTNDHIETVIGSTIVELNGTTDYLDFTAFVATTNAGFSITGGLIVVRLITKG